MRASALAARQPRQGELLFEGETVWGVENVEGCGKSSSARGEGVLILKVTGLAECAVLCCAVLCCAVLCCAVLCCAVLCYADRDQHSTTQLPISCA